MAIIEPTTHRLKGGEQVVIRSSIEADAASILEHLRDLRATSEFLVTQAGEGVQSVEDEVAWIRKRRDNPAGLSILAECVGGDGAPRVVGVLDFAVQDRRRVAHHGHLGLGVSSTHRGRGLGRLLMNTLLDWARAHPSILKVCLGCFADNTPALNLYRSLGFVEEGRRMGEFQYEDGRFFDDVQMMLWVKPPPSDVTAWLAKNGPRCAR